MTLGNTDVRIPPMGIGTWAWGDRIFWNYGRSHTDVDIREAFDASLQGGVPFFDTAEIYGRGRSERLLGKFIRESGQPVVVATKFFPYPWRFDRGAMQRAVRGSLKRLGLSRVDLYQIHWPIGPRGIEVWVNELVEVVQNGQARAVGVSNYNLEQMRVAHRILADDGVPLASNQVEYSLLHRKPEFDGLLAACHEMGVTLIAYSPLAMGILTGKYGPGNPPPGLRGRRWKRERLEKVRPLLDLLREIGQAHDRTPSQVALNWVICKGAVPIPGAKNARQAQANAGALGWRLTEAEVEALDHASADLG